MPLTARDAHKICIYLQHCTTTSMQEISRRVGCAYQDVLDIYHARAFKHISDNYNIRARVDRGCNFPTGSDCHSRAKADKNNSVRKKGKPGCPLKIITINGVTKTKKGWAAYLNISESRLDNMLKKDPTGQSIGKPRGKDHLLGKKYKRPSDGIEKTVAGWAEFFGKTVAGIGRRLRDYPIEIALDPSMMGKKSSKNIHK